MVKKLLRIDWRHEIGRQAPNARSSLVLMLSHPRRRNLWPGQELPELRPAFRGLGQLIIAVGQLLAAHCDAYVERLSVGRDVGRLRRTIAESSCPKVTAAAC